MAPLRVLLILVALGVGACGPGQPDGIDPAAQAAWETYRESPDPTTFERFIAKNRLAAHAHAHPYDALGVLYQVRALEAQTEQALREDDAALAETVTLRVNDIETGELLVVFDEVLPGSKERLLAARAQLDERFR